MNSNQFEKIEFKDINYNCNKNIDLNLKEQRDPNIYYNSIKDTSSIIYSKKRNNIRHKSFNQIPYDKIETYNSSKNISYTPIISISKHSLEEINNYNSNSLLENQLTKLKKNYITLYNDNIILREDINKLFDLNKQLEEELESERNNNYDLAKENDILNNESQDLLNKLEEVNHKIIKIKDNYQKEEEIMNKQLYFEEKIKERDLGCMQISEENDKLNNEYNLLNDKFNKLQEKNNKDEKELYQMKQIQENNISDIENKLTMLLGEMNKLKNENNMLRKENESYKNNLINNEKEKKEYYNKYQEQKIKNEIINKENEDIQMKLQEYKIQLENKIKNKNKNNKEKKKKNKSDNKINVIKDLQKKIQQYKTERTKRQMKYIKDDEDS